MHTHQGRSGRSSVALALAALAIAVGAATNVQQARADIACTTRTTTTPFTAWGDSNRYFVAPNGGFESGTTSWTLSSGASIATENEPNKINGSTHAKSVNLGAGASAMGERFCVNSSEDSLRVFYKRPGVVGSALKIAVRVTSGVNVATNELTVDGSTAGWALSQRMMLPDIRDASGQQWVQITFMPVNVGATWRVDDLMIDPWRTN